MIRSLLLASLLVVVGLPGAARAGDCGQYLFCGAEGKGDGSYHGVVVIPGLQGGSGKATGGGSCEGCEWSLVPACWTNGPENPDALCGAAVLSCPARGQQGILMWVFRRRPPAGWEHVGNVCVGPNDPVLTVADLQADARRYVGELGTTAATVGVAPSHYTPVVNTATYFTATGGGTRTGTFGPQGVRLTITATPTYVWDFGDGSAPYETSSPGGPYPSGDVTHTYTTPGARTVTLTTRWTATFTVATALGTFGPFPVGGAPIAPVSTRAIQVREAGAVLVH